MATITSSSTPEVGQVVIGQRAYGTSKRRQRITVRVVDADLGIVVGDLMGKEGGPYEGDYLGTATLMLGTCEVQA